ncbi:MAG: transcription elongation factor GreA [Acidaminobacteraceae bacterium]
MVVKEILLTVTALEKIKAELNELIKKRKEISEEIKKARGFGDLSENAEYHAARESQSLNETEILKLKAFLENYILVEDENGLSDDIITMNSDVKIKYDGDDEVENITIVSKVESDPIGGLLSVESPIGEALMGKTIGDVVEVPTPDGIFKIEVLSVTKKHNK